MAIIQVRIEKVRKILDPEEFMFLIASCLTPQEISLLSRRVGINYSGYRTGSIPQDILVADLAEEFFNDRNSAELVANFLDNKCSPEKALFEKDMKKDLHDLSDQEIGFLLWGLLGKAEECQDFLNSVLDNVQDRIMEEQWQMVEQEKEHFESALEESEVLKKRLDEMEKRAEKFRHQKEKLERKIEGLLQKLSQKEGSLEELYSKYRHLEKESQQLKSELTSITAKIGNANKLEEESEKEIQEKELLKSRICSLEKELALKEEKLRNLKNLKRVGVFVDAQNLYYTAKEEFGGKLDYEAFLDKIIMGRGKEDRFLAGAYAYLVESPEKDQTKFKKLLESLGFQVKFRELLERSDGSKKANWDLGLTIDILQNISRFDVVVIASGDGDFVDLIRYLKRQYDEVEVEVAAFPSRQRTSQRLIKEADYFHELNQEVIIS